MKNPCVISIVLGLLVAGTSDAPRASTLPEGFRLEPVIYSELTDPSAMASLPDGRILITERTTGNVRLFRHGVLDPVPVCEVPVEVAGTGGLLGIAVDPDFGSNHWFYLYYTHPDNDGTNRITRYRLLGRECFEPTDLLGDLGDGTTGFENGGGMAFGPDGKLYVATGDMGEPIDAQDMSSSKGKILRVEADGTVPHDNPTPGSPVYARGVRDGRGIAVHGDLVYSTDSGEFGYDDELNPIPAGGNLGWPIVWGVSGGPFDDPIHAWNPTIGVGDLTFYAAGAFPDRADDGLDNDRDRWGPDRYPGGARVDDNGFGVCVGSANNGQPCASTLDCAPPRPGETSIRCEMRDEPSEWCPNDEAHGDDSCGSIDPAGLDEPDESFRDNIFIASENSIQRTVLAGPQSTQLSSQITFLDSTEAADCPLGWVDVMTGREGDLYALARNGGGSDGGLFRIIHDEQPGPREVSRPGSHFPLTVEKGATADQLVVRWEDLRTDAMQPRDDNHPDPELRVSLAPQREYTVWIGQLGAWYSHVAVPGLDATPGVAVSEVLRQTMIDTSILADDLYFLVSARHANLEGTLGHGAQGERPGYAVTDVCDSVGYHEEPSFDLWTCGHEFELLDEYVESLSLYDDLREHVVVMCFCSNWCAPCILEANELNLIHREYDDRGVRVLTVLMDAENFTPLDGRPTPAECRQWTEREPHSPDLEFPCVADAYFGPGLQEAWPNYRRHGIEIPTTVILDRGLRVVHSSLGYFAGVTPAEIRAVLDTLVDPPGSCLD